MGSRQHLAEVGKPVSDKEWIKRWICSECGTKYPVQILARDCEDKHKQT